MENTFTAVLDQHGDWWIGYIEELPRANTWGARLDEARENLKQVVQFVLEANRERLGFRLRVARVKGRM